MSSSLGDNLVQEESTKKENTKQNQIRSNAELKQWLQSIDLEMYLESFLKQNLDLQSITELDDDHLKELGISVGHRIKLKKAIENLKSVQVHAEPLEHVEYVCKVIVVGDIGTGKTSLIQRYTNGTFDKNYKATIGVDFCLKELQWNKNTTVSIQLWDIAGQERFANLTRMYYKEARGAFVVFDVFREKTFDAVLKWKQDIDSKVTLPNGDVIPVVLIANKCDMLDDPKRKAIDLDDFCKKHGFKKWFLTSAKEDIGINEASQFLVKSILENDESFGSQTTTEYGAGLVLRADSKPQNQKQNSGCCS